MTDRHIDERISAWMDGELTPEEAREVEARLEQDPALREEVESLRALGRVLHRAAERWEDEVSFDGFYDRVAEALPAEAPARPARRAGLWAGLSDLFRGHRSAVAAAVATLLVVVGGTSFYWLDVARTRPSLELGDAPARIEDLEVENASAVVYRTQENVTVIWLTEEGS